MPLSDEQKVLAGQLFTTIDRDRNGAVDRNEFDYLMQLWTQGNGAPSAATIDLLFGQLAGGAHNKMTLPQFEQLISLLMGGLPIEVFSSSCRSILALAAADDAAVEGLKVALQVGCHSPWAHLGLYSA